METTSIEEKNREIAEFMGWTICDCGDKPIHYKYGEMNWQVVDLKNIDFDKNWKSLMPVIEYIEFNGYDVLIKKSSCWIMDNFDKTVASILDVEPKILATHTAVYEFIINQKNNKE